MSHSAADSQPPALVSGRTLVIIPTYNERENISPIVDRLRAAVPGADVLIVDDNSPDGTGQLVDNIAASDQRVFVIHRAAKQGLGRAYIAAFRWGLDRGYETLVEMDADGSHAPEQLMRILQQRTYADVVIGSRYVPGGKVVNWPWHRQLLSRGANVYARLLLGSHLRDMTAGFRAYRATVLQTLDLSRVASDGYCFQIELAWRSQQGGFRVSEVPITFTERALGTSKMRGAVIQEAIFQVARWGITHRWQQILRRFSQ